MLRSPFSVFFADLDKAVLGVTDRVGYEPPFGRFKDLPRAGDFLDLSKVMTDISFTS